MQKLGGIYPNDVSKLPILLFFLRFCSFIISVLLQKKYIWNNSVQVILLFQNHTSKIFSVFFSQESFQKEILEQLAQKYFLLCNGRLLFTAHNSLFTNYFNLVTRSRQNYPVKLLRSLSNQIRPNWLLIIMVIESNGNLLRQFQSLYNLPENNVTCKFASKFVEARNSPVKCRGFSSVVDRPLCMREAMCSNPHNLHRF